MDLSAEGRADTPGPVLRHAVATDATLEGLKIALADSPGVCCAVDELAGWVGSKNQ